MYVVFPDFLRHKLYVKLRQKMQTFRSNILHNFYSYEYATFKSLDMKQLIVQKLSTPRSEEILTAPMYWEKNLLKYIESKKICISFTAQDNFSLQ